MGRGRIDACVEKTRRFARGLLSTFRSEIIIPQEVWGGEIVLIKLPFEIAASSRSAAALLIVAQLSASGATEKNAHVTRIIRDVELLPSESEIRPAVVNDTVSEGTGVRTGDDSRTELTFADLTITRLGEKTIFSFNKGGRSVQLDSGSILLRVPKDSGGARMTTSAVTVGITGTTVIFESTREGRSKLTVLEGGARLSLNKYPRESALIHAGQMLDVKAGATKLPPPVEVDLDRIMKTSPLITDFPPLPSRDLILATIRDQNSHVYPSRPVGGGPTGSGPVFIPGQPVNPGGPPPTYWPGRSRQVVDPGRLRPSPTPHRPRPSPTPRKAFPKPLPGRPRSTPRPTPQKIY